jgi:mannan endo-1,4-beta-mannosidase
MKNPGRNFRQKQRNGTRLAGAIALTSFAVTAAVSFLSAKRANAEPAPTNPEPVNPDATPEARELLKKIAAISGRFTLTGQQNFASDLSRYSDRVYDLTGKYPGIFGQDFGFSDGDEGNSFCGRPAMIDEVERQHRNAAVIALTWHAPCPADDEPLTYERNVLAHMTDSSWKEILAPGTSLYGRWVKQVDVIAGYLRRLKVAGIPVLFRPYHEMNGRWFWWGGRPGEHGSAALYRQLYDRYVNVHRLNNLIWVWNVNSPGKYAGPIADYFPGPQFVDIVSMDNYGRFKRSYYKDALALAGSKPIALAEVGAMPTVDVLARQPRWAYFMIWRGFAEEANSPEQLQTIFSAPNVLNRGDVPFLA